MGHHAKAAEGGVSLEALDLVCVHLARGQARKRLRLGELAHRFLSGDKHQVLCFGDVQSYAREQLDRSAAWLWESRRVAARLAELPETRRALARGEITWKMAELLGRHATAEDERMLLAAARKSTLREMGELLAECDAAKREADEERMVTVTRRVDVDTFWDCEVTEKLVAHLDGQDVGSRWIESVVAEATSTFHNAGVDPLVESAEAQCRSWDARRRTAERFRDRDEAGREEAAEAAGRPLWDRGEAMDLEPIDDPIPDDAHQLDAMMRGLVREMNADGLALGDAAGEMKRRGGFRALNHASFEQWVRERLGLGRATVMRKISLARDAARFPQLGAAVRRGQTGAGAAALVARVADERTIDDWLSRTVRRTQKHLREELEVAERRAGVRGLSKGGAPIYPPNPTEMEHFFADERAILSGARLREALAENAPVSFCEVDGPAAERRGPSTREIRFRIPVDAFIELRMMEVAFERSSLEGSFYSFICRTYWATWLPWLGESNKWEHIHRRDRYRCACPVCHRRDVTLHHLKYRSAGGGDEPANLASICAFHHLDGEHGGRLKVTGTAGHMTWRLGPPGRKPVMLIVGRERVA